MGTERGGGGADTSSWVLGETLERPPCNLALKPRVYLQVLKGIELEPWEPHSRVECSPQSYVGQAVAVFWGLQKRVSLSLDPIEPNSD